MSKATLVWRMVLTLWVAVPTLAAATEAQLHWYVVNRSPSYTLAAQGDPWSGDGVAVTLARTPEGNEPWGSGAAGIDARPFAGRDVILSADVATTGGAANAAIWLRADSASPLGRAFQTTQGHPVNVDSAALARSVRLFIPRDATEVVVGVLLTGPGVAHFNHLRLAVADPERTAIDAPALLDEALALIRAHALNAGNVDWDAFRKEVDPHLDKGDPAYVAYPAIRYAITKLADGHSFFMDPTRATAESTVDGTRFPPVVKLLPGGVGYVRLPGMTGPVEARQYYAETVASAIAALAPSVTGGWIVDLREDTGGSVPPMLAGVRALLGSGLLGGYRTPARPDQPIHADRGLGFPVKPTMDLTHEPVAVLLGPHTASAGEGVAVAFHGRPATRSFGLPTFGQANGNAVFPLKDGSSVVLKSAIAVDRSGVVFGKQVLPDERVEGDAAVDRAKAWLAQQVPRARAFVGLLRASCSPWVTGVAYGLRLRHVRNQPNANVQTMA
ncbi:S41 family peptidase [Bacillus sp. NP157]|nr:S41 family peptidase [Bacillus sp. NP157]